MDQCIAK